MTFFDAITSLWDWSPFDWGNQVETIWKTSMSKKKSSSFEQNIKTVLSWVVVSRTVIAHIYTLTYIPNLYSIFLWCQRRMLLPWMVMSAFKNFVLEVIVFIVVVLLYVEGNICDLLFGGIILEKLISIGLAAHNWLTINTFYMNLKELDQRTPRMSQRTASTFNLMIGMSMRHPLRLEPSPPHSRKRQRFISVPNLELAEEFGRNSIRISRSLNTISMLSIRCFDNNIFNPDSTVPERVIMILGISNAYVANVKQESLSQSIVIQEDVSDLSCTCPSDVKSSEENLVDSKEESIKSIDYSGWSEQWTLTNILGDQIVEEDVDVSDKSIQYSEQSDSVEESVSSLETRPTYLIRNNIKVQEKVLQKVLTGPDISEVIEATEEDKTIFETWIRDLVFVGILKKEGTEGNGSNLKDVRTNSSPPVVQRHTQTEVKWENDNQVNFVAVQNLILPGNGWTELGSKLEVKNLEKKKHKELEALKLYNEKTLWKYKRLMDLEKKSPEKNIKLENFLHKKDSPKGRELNKVKAVENIPALLSSKKKSVDLKTRISQIDWTFPRFDKCFVQGFKYKETIFDEIDDRDVGTLLQSAFSFDYHEFRGFPLGPREFYSVRTDYIPNVIEEIVKAARISVIRHDCPNYSTLEVDYGDEYLKKWETFGEKEVFKAEVSRTEIIRRDIEPQFQDTQVLLIENWMKKYKEIVSSNENRSLQELASLPGFSLLKKLIREIDSLASESVSLESEESVNSLPNIIQNNVELVEEDINQNNAEIGEENNLETHPNIFDDECSWSDESATYLNDRKTSETSLGNESNMSEFPDCL